MIGWRWITHDPRRSFCLLACTLLAFVLYALTNTSTWTRLLTRKSLYDSQHTVPTRMRESKSDTDTKEGLTQSSFTVAHSQLPPKTALTPSHITALPSESLQTTRSMATLAALLTFPPPRSPEMYVRSAYMGTGQLGNSMFEYISSYVTAMRLGLKFVVVAEGTQPQAYQQMSSLFRTTAPLYSGNFYVDRSINELGWGIYSPALAKLESYGLNTQVVGWLQSWRYLAGCEHFVRKEFALTDRYKLFVSEFFSKHGVSFTADDKMSVTLIAVHVRRGDMLRHLDQYQMASPQYLARAIAYFQERYALQRPTFVVATDDKLWTRAIVDGSLQNDSVPVIYTSGTAEEDMAVLSSCHHAIITGGTYGWWIAWLTGGNVMYFRDFIWNGSVEWPNYIAEDYYPPHWMGLT